MFSVFPAYYCMYYFNFSGLQKYGLFSYLAQVINALLPLIVVIPFETYFDKSFQTVCCYFF